MDKFTEFQICIVHLLAFTKRQKRLEKIFMRNNYKALKLVKEWRELMEKPKTEVFSSQ